MTEDLSKISVEDRLMGELATLKWAQCIVKNHESKNEIL